MRSRALVQYVEAGAKDLLSGTRIPGAELVVSRNHGCSRPVDALPEIMQPRSAALILGPSLAVVALHSEQGAAHHQSGRAD